MESDNRHYDKERTPCALSLSDVCHERNCLDRLTQAHLVGQNTIDALLIQVIEPAKTSQLIMFESSSEDLRLLDSLCWTF